jgi:hypothetical protein
MGRQERNKQATNRCPDCGAPMVQSGGCGVCMHCGYGKCG